MFLLLLPALACSTDPVQGELPLDRIQLPPGFVIETYAYPVPGARSLARSPSGTLFVGTRDAGKVYAIRDGGGDAATMFNLAEGLNMPNGVAFRDGSLYVAEVHRVIRFDEIEAHLADPPAPVVVTDSFPRDTHHGWKFIAFGPDGKLYVPVGAPCNVCLTSVPSGLIGGAGPHPTYIYVYAVAGWLWIRVNMCMPTGSFRRTAAYV